MPNAVCAQGIQVRSPAEPSGLTGSPSGEHGRSSLLSLSLLSLRKLDGMAGAGIYFNRMVEYGSSLLDQVFTAVADPTRRAILDALARKPAKITEIARPFPVSLNAISKHIKTLERAGLIRRVVVGREHYCHLEPRALRPVTDWLEHHRAFWEARLEALERHVVAKRRRGRGGDEQTE
jgi:DNA-binding transcriptional ArsR family regulator